MRDRFLFKEYIFDALSELDAETYVLCMKMIVDYAYRDIEPQGDNPPLVNAFFHGLRGELDRVKAKIDKEDARGSRQYLEWRNQVFHRDGFTCQKCGKVGGKLNAHHIKTFAGHPESRFDIDNGITLCEKCHKEVHRNAR